MYDRDPKAAPAPPSAADPDSPDAPLRIPDWMRQPRPPLPPLPPPRRRLSGRAGLGWVALGLAAVLLVCGGPVAATVGAAHFLQAPERTRSALPAPEGTTVPTAPPSPRPGDPPEVAAVWMRSRIEAAMTAQSGALLRGDEKAFLAAAVTTATRTELLRRYRNLRAMKVTVFQLRVAAVPVSIKGSGGRAEWQTSTWVEHCFVVPACVPDRITVTTRWLDAPAGPRLVSIGASAADDNGPRPWEVSELRVAVGQRVVAATTKAYAGRLSTLLREADKAAVVADRYAIGDTPDVYRVYLAGGTEWRKWYGGGLPTWAAGYSVNVGAYRDDVVVQQSQAPASYLDDMLRHEMAHASSAGVDRLHWEDRWWLLEGLAEQAEFAGMGIGAFDWLPELRSHVRNGWNGRLPTDAPAAKASARTVGIQYGLAFLAVRWLEDTYGRAKLLEFFEAVVHDGRDYDRAAELAFGTPWKTVLAGCVRFIRQA